MQLQYRALRLSHCDPTGFVPGSTSNRNSQGDTTDATLAIILTPDVLVLIAGGTNSSYALLARASHDKPQSIPKIVGTYVGKVIRTYVSLSCCGLSFFLYSNGVCTHSISAVASKVLFAAHNDNEKMWNSFCFKRPRSPRHGGSVFSSVNNKTGFLNKHYRY